MDGAVISIPSTYPTNANICKNRATAVLHFRYISNVRQSKKKDSFPFCRHEREELCFSGFMDLVMAAVQVCRIVEPDNQEDGKRK